MSYEGVSDVFCVEVRVRDVRGVDDTHALDVVEVNVLVIGCDARIFAFELQQ